MAEHILLPICKPIKAKQEQQRQQRIAEEEEKKKKEAEQAAKKKEEEQEKQKGNNTVTKMLPQILGHFGSIINWVALKRADFEMLEIIRRWSSGMKLFQVQRVHLERVLIG